MKDAYELSVMEDSASCSGVEGRAEEGCAEEEGGLISSKKINLKKKIRLAWLIMAVVFVVNTVFAFIRYSEYKKEQEVAAGLMISNVDEFSMFRNEETYNSAYERMIWRMYDYFNPPIQVWRFMGYDVDGLSDAARDADEALGDLMETLGYDCYGSVRGSVYFMCVGFFDFVFNFNHLYLVQSCYGIWSIIAVILLADTLWYVDETKKIVSVDVIRVTCRKGRKTKKEFLVKDIKSVESIAIKGLLLRGDNFKYRTRFLENRDELKAYIMELLSASYEEKGTPEPEMTENSTIGAADELKKYKDFLDSGILTQEEFDAKKKQLLGL